MNNLFAQLQVILASVKNNMPLTLKIMAIFWGIHFLNVLLKYRLNLFGLYPRSIPGIVGIFTSPFLHANFNHLFFNSIPIFVLINCILILGFHKFLCVSIFVIVVSGIAVWLLGRPAIHVGASGLIMGYFGYLLANAYQHFSVMTIILVVVIIYYFSGLFFEIVPTRRGVSFESHLFGFLSGIAAVYWCI